MCSGMERLRKKMAGGRSQVFHHCSGKLQISKVGSLELGTSYWIRVKDISMNLCLV